MHRERTLTATGGSWFRLSLGLGLGLGLTCCSTVDRDPTVQCNDDDDCGDGAVCSLAQGHICVPEQLPPRTVLGFDIGQGDLHIELRGCDPEVTRELAGNLLRVQKFDSLVQIHELRASESRSVINCGGGDCEGVCDEDALMCTTQTDARLRLSSSSRFGLGELSQFQDYVTVPETPPAEGELPPPVAIEWPNYQSEEDKAHAALELEVTPPDGETDRSTYWRVIADDAPPELETSGRVRCQRAIFGNEGAVRTRAGAPISGATIDFTYNEPIATSSTVLGSGSACANDEDCPIGWACGPDSSCGLDLSGTLAGSSISLQDPAGAFPAAYLYTYCEDSIDDPLLRQLRVQVTPDAGSGLPKMIYDLEQGFTLQAQEDLLKGVEVEGGLCLPNWEPPQAIGFSVDGSPIALGSNELGVYTCCSTECLPDNEVDVEPTPPPTAESCHDFKEIEFETRWFNPDEMEWVFAGCTPTGANSDGSSGIFERKIEECDEQGCSVALTAGELGVDETRSYHISIEQPDGSVFRSQHFTVTIDSETTELEPFVLEPRVLLRGEIVCVGTRCSASNALVAAERLRVDGEDSDLPGPFHYQTHVDTFGSFVLPVDPGVYVITAYPAVGQAGGPSPFAVLDLREGSSLLEEVDGILTAALGDPLELDDGVLVQVLLRDFQPSTGVRPLDMGSWASQSGWPGVPDLPELEGLDLNDPLACHGRASRGCVIRRVRPTSTPISLLIDGRFQFTTRDRGKTDCG